MERIFLDPSGPILEIRSNLLTWTVRYILGPLWEHITIPPAVGCSHRFPSWGARGALLSRKRHQDDAATNAARRGAMRRERRPHSIIRICNSSKPARRLC